MATFYDDEQSESPAHEAQETPEQEAQEHSEETNNGDEKTALIPSSLAPEMEVGDTVTLKIVAVHDGEYQVVRQGEEKEEPRESSLEGAMQANRTASFLED